MSEQSAEKPDFLNPTPSIEGGEVYGSTGEFQGGTQIYAVRPSAPEATKPEGLAPQETPTSSKEDAYPSSSEELPTNNETLRTNVGSAAVDGPSIVNYRIKNNIFDPTNRQKYDNKPNSGFISGYGPRRTDAIESTFGVEPRLKERKPAIGIELDSESGVSVLTEESPNQLESPEDNANFASQAAKFVANRIKDVRVDSQDTPEGIRQKLNDAIEEAENNFLDTDAGSRPRNRRPGPALAALTLLPGNRAAVITLGTPTVHLLRDNQLHTYRDDTNKSERTKSMRVFGFAKNGEPDIKIIDVQPGDRLALTTQAFAKGFYSSPETITDKTRGKFLEELRKGSPEEAAQDLIKFPEDVAMPTLKDEGYESDTTDRAAVVIDVEPSKNNTKPESPLNNFQGEIENALAELPEQQRQYIEVLKNPIFKGTNIDKILGGLYLGNGIQQFYEKLRNHKNPSSLANELLKEVDAADDSLPKNDYRLKIKRDMLGDETSPRDPTKTKADIAALKAYLACIMQNPDQEPNWPTGSNNISKVNSTIVMIAEMQNMEEVL